MYNNKYNILCTIRRDWGPLTVLTISSDFKQLIIIRLDFKLNSWIQCSMLIFTIEKSRVYRTTFSIKIYKYREISLLY